MHKHLQMTKLTANIKHTFLSFQANCYCNFGCFGVIPFLKGLRVFIEDLNRSLILLNRVKDTRQERLTFNFFVNNFRQIQYIVLCCSVPSLVFLENGKGKKNAWRVLHRKKRKSNQIYDGSCHCKTTRQTGINVFWNVKNVYFLLPNPNVSFSLTPI